MNRELVRKAAAEYFLEGFHHAETERVIARTSPDQRADAFESLRFQRSVPDGCFAWISHLVWLESLLEIAPVPLTAVEAEGLVALKRERIRFQAEHPACPHCGMPNSKHAFSCRECMQAIEK